jgi:hypothetical protein
MQSVSGADPFQALSEFTYAFLVSSGIALAASIHH